VARANHSNFPECTECRNNRKEKEQNIASRAPRELRDATNAKQVAHVRECSDERAVTSAWVREAGRSANQVHTGLQPYTPTKDPNHWHYSITTPYSLTSAPHTLSHSALRQVAELDDKLGSEWNFLPQPPNMRFGKETSSRCTCMCLARIALVLSSQ
jgi:hypothetical protein